jgi:hypothetical protein
MTLTSKASRPLAPPWSVARSVLGLVIVIAIAHGPSLWYGQYLDDLPHAAQLREAEWTLRSLVDACRLELVGGAVDMWWLPDTTLRFFRPVAFGLMKLVYTLSDWNPVAAHAASLTWHLAVCVLLWALMRSVGVSGRLAWCVAALFAIHPGHVATVQWIAAQSELMVTTFVLSSLLCFARLREWGSASVVGETPGDVRSRRMRASWGVLSLALFAIALGCRENAIMLPFAALAVDLLHRRSSLREAWVWYAGFGLVVAGYLVLRWSLLGGSSLPPRPYIVAPSEPDFLRYVLDKMCYYVLGEFLFMPCIPIGGLAYLRGVPLVFYGLTLALLLVFSVAAWKKRSLPITFGAVGLFGFMAPVLPAFESPHHLYLPGVGAALLLAGLLTRTAARRGPPRAAAAIAFVSALSIMGLMTYLSSLTLNTARQVEAMVIDEIVSSPRPIQAGDTILYANMPMLAHYTQYGVRARTGLNDVRVVALSWAPRVLGVHSPAALRVINERTIEMRLGGDRYFAGPFGRLVAEANGRSIEAMLVEPLRGDGFVVALAGSDERGISALRFTFDRALTEGGVRLFWGSSTRWAAQIPEELLREDRHGPE